MLERSATLPASETVNLICGLSHAVKNLDNTSEGNLTQRKLLAAIDRLTATLEPAKQDEASGD